MPGKIEYELTLQLQKIQRVSYNSYNLVIWATPFIYYNLVDLTGIKIHINK